MFPFCSPFCSIGTQSAESGTQSAESGTQAKSSRVQAFSTREAPANRVMAAPKSPLPESARVMSRRLGKRGRSLPTPEWNPMTAHTVSSLVQQFAHRTKETGSLQGQRGVYADLRIGEYRLRLQALAWSKAGMSKAVLTDRELNLLLLLGPIANSYLPVGSELTVTENNLRHVGQSLCWSSSPTCLYTQIFGDWEKQFSVQVSLPNAMSLVLPSLTFSRPPAE